MFRYVPLTFIHIYKYQSERNNISESQDQFILILYPSTILYHMFYFIAVLLLLFPWYMGTDNVAIKSEHINLGLKSIRASHQLSYLINDN